MSNICPPVKVYMDTYTPTKYGLFSVAKPFPEADPHWVTCGVEYESYACPQTDVFIHQCTSPGTKATGQTPVIRTAAPFTVYGSWDCAAGGKTPEEHREAALSGLNCSLEREVEGAFYLGTTEDTPQLVNAGCTALNTTATPYSIAAGIGALEGAMGIAQCGEPTLWFPRELGALAARFNQTFGAGNMLRSAMGSPMAFGTGFGNLSPVGVAPPAGIAWVYATGPLYMARGGAFLNPPTYEDAFNRTNNRLKWLAEETVLLSIDGCACFAVAVSTNGS